MNPFHNEPSDCWAYAGVEIAIVSDHEDDTYKYHHYYRTSTDGEWKTMRGMSPYRSRRADVEAWIDQNLNPIKIKDC